MLTRTMLILIISSFLFGQSEPDWYKSIPETKGMMYAKGEGDKKMKAVLSGLEDLAMKYKPSVESMISSFSIEEGKSIKNTFTSSAEVATSESLLYHITDGKFILESRTTHFQKETGVDFDSELLDDFEIFISKIFDVFSDEVNVMLICHHPALFANEMLG